MATWAQVSNDGVPDRRGQPTAIMGWERPYDQDLPAVLPHVWQGAFEPASVRVQRHVEAVPEGDCEEGGPGGPRVGSVPRDGQDEQGDRRGSCGRGETAGGWRLRP